MTELLKKAYDPEEFRKAGYQLVDILADHLGRCLTKKEQQVLPWQPPEDLFAEWENELNRETLSATDFWKRAVSQTIHIHHPNYFGHQVCAAVPLSGLGELVNGTLNNGSAIYEMGPVSSAMEHVVIRWLAKAMGFSDQADGFLTSGGSMGNLTALLAARQAQSSYDHWKTGRQNHNQPAIMVSEEAHYSIARSVQILGWGEQGIIKLPVNSDHSVNTRLLSSVYEKNRAEGKDILVMVANACSTATGTYDPIDEMADFCADKGIWLHVDGAHGGAAALSPKYRHLTRGIQRADSVVIDFHKMMGVSALTTAVLYRDPDPGYRAFEQKASYILNQGNKHEWYNSAKRTIECTKNMVGMKVYAILKIHGEQFFIDYLETCYDLGRQFAEMIRQQADFELAHDPQSNILVFRYMQAGVSDEELNRINRRIRQEAVQEGRFYLVQTEINNRIFLRTVLMNPFTTESEMNGLVDYLRQLTQSKAS